MVVSLAVSPTTSFLSGALRAPLDSGLGACFPAPAAASAASCPAGSKQPQSQQIGFHVVRGPTVACKATTRHFEAVASKARTRRGKRRNSSGSGDDDDQDEYLLQGGSGGDSGGSAWGSGGGGQWGGNGGSSWGSHWGDAWQWGSSPPGGYNNGAFRFNKAFYECMWFWQLLCAASLVQALHFVMVGADRKTSGAAAAASVTVATAAAVHAGSSL